MEKTVLALTCKAPATIVIDAGHGGEDSGAVADNGTLEKDINLDIAQRLNNMLVASGFNTIMTREHDVSIHERDSKTLREKKASDMKNRLNIINSNPNNILISIHQNKFTEKQYCGTQIFYSKNHPASKELAESIKLSFSELIQPENKRETKPADKNIYILHNSKIPAVIVECGFISNDSELEKLTNEEYRKKLAFSIYCGILNCKITKTD
ncbi:MAG: Germination-specific N-acetylmuramoyl-L-alanine amidase [Eubacteriales bacterium SKADARSKE-1]|nr:Germination-specific N-acetylmuramoyl-L-alanine amidase [Eubacteriales bacterium SKADARSKE-1]